MRRSYGKALSEWATIRLEPSPMPRDPSKQDWSLGIAGKGLSSDKNRPEPRGSQMLNRQKSLGMGLPERRRY
jgi:hypothetical protein